jgi:AGZA family xanthine/uracil permease-like MFS transporter
MSPERPAPLLERVFRLSENGTTVRTEVLAGLTTFLTMAYIVFVQPAVLSGSMFGKPTGMDFGAVMAATCLSAALATAIMGLYARYPIAQAPGMGENFFFVFAAIPAAAAFSPEPWRVALGVVFVSGVLFVALSFLGVRERLLDAISPSMKSAIAGGIGLFIAFLGLQHGGIVVADPATGVKLNPRVASPDAAVFFFGLLLGAGLSARRVRGAILWGILGAVLLAGALKLALPHLPASLAASPAVAGSQLASKFAFAKGVVSAPPSLAPTFLKMDLAGALAPAMWPFILVFLFMVVFDTVGTLVGVAERAGFIRDNKLPRSRQAFVSDAVASLVGAGLGTSTVTSYIESATGVEQGGRTGLAALTVAALFLLALFFQPLVAMVGNYPPAAAPALVLVGAMMARSVAKVDWEDFTEAVPAFLVLVGIPLGYSIADGLALGFIAHPVVKLLAGRGKETSWLSRILAVVLVVYFARVRVLIG